MIKYHCTAMIFYCAKKARKIISSIIFVLMVFGLGTGVAFASLTGNDNQSFVKFVYKNIEKEILSDKFVNIKKYFTDASNQIPNLKEILAKDIKPIEIKKVFSFNNGGAMVAGVFNTVSGTIKNFIFTRNNQSDQGESDAVSPVYSYTREEVDKIVKNKTEEIRKEILNLKSQVQSSEGNKTIINQPVSERVVEKIIETKTQVSGISQNELEERLLNLNTSLLNRISQVESNANTQTTGVYRAVSLTNRINNLSNITVSGVTGLTDSDIPDTITASNYLPLSGGAVTGNLTVDTSTLVVDSANDRVGIGTTSPTDTFSLNGAAFLANISAPSVTTNRLYSSSGNLYWNGSVIGGGIGNWTLSGSDIYYNTGNVGIGTTSPNWKLSVAGIGSFDDYVRASYFTATSTTATSTFPYLAVTTNSNLGTIVGGTWQANAIGAQYGGTGIDSSALTGIAQITSGTWSASSTLSTAYGGTGWNSVQSNSILLGNGSGRLATTTSGTDGQVLALVNGTPTWQSTTTLSTISGTLGVSQGGTGLTSYTQGDVLYASGSGTLAGTTTANLKTTLSLNNVENTALSTWAGSSNLTTLGTVNSGTWNSTAIGAQYGGTGQNFSASSGLVNFYSGTASTIATSSLGLLTTNVAEGSNLYWTTDRFDTRLAATTTLPNLTTLLGLTNASTTLLTVSSNAYFPGSGIWNSSGNLGVGTTSPNWKLSVAGAGSFDDYVRASYFTATSTTATSSIAGVFSVGSTTPAANALFSVGTSSPLLFIDKHTGNVGVGTLGGSARRLEVLDVANPQLRLSQDSTTYTDFTVAPSTGDLTLSLYPSGSANDIILTMPGGSTGANLWVCEGTACPSATFTDGGNLYLEGSIKYATSTTPKTRRSIILTAAGAVTPTTSGAAKTQVDGTNSHSYYVLDYDYISDEAAYWQWTMPDSYDDGAIEVTYYWETAATTGNVVWCFQSVGIQADGNEDMEPDLSSWPSECTTDSALASANDLSSVTEAATSSRFTAGEYVAFKVFRDADNGSDTINSNDARLVKVKIEYGVDQESD